MVDLEFLKRLHHSISVLPSAESRLEKAVDTICQFFSVTSDEVAIFKIDENDILNFIWPPKLRTSGFIPLSAINSLVAKTAREKKAFVNNTFATTPHASIFEQAGSIEGAPLPIQKIMSVPLCVKGNLRGVIQVSRKGNMPSEKKDFSEQDVALLQRLGTVIVVHI